MSPVTAEPNYIAVEGVIGVGKTTFASMLAARIEAEVIYEDAINNPFLADFYKNRKRHALPCQLYFLASRFQQQQQLISHDLFAKRIVADYLYAKDSIFASVNLSDRELVLYNRIANALSHDVPKPDLVIYLQASTQKLLERIRLRNLSFERGIDPDYIDVLNKAYDYFFFNYTDTPLLVVKTENIDFVNNADHFDDLIAQLRKPVAGKKYYSPSGDLAAD